MFISEFGPGVTIAEELAERRWSRGVLAQRMGVTEAFVDQLIESEQLITESTAKQLARAFEGTGVAFWLRLEASYRKAAGGAARSRR